MAIKICQINIARSYSGTLELIEIVRKRNFDIILVQEPFRTKNIKWPGYRMYSGTVQNYEMWTQTMVAEHITPVVLLAESSTPTCTTISIQHEQNNIILINAYFRRRYITTHKQCRHYNNKT